MEFDLRGYLQPPKELLLDIDTFKQEFVDNFPDSETRSVIFEQFEGFNSQFQEEVTDVYLQWVGGSFTTKKLNPRDIDVVMFIEHSIFEEKENLIRSKYGKNAVFFEQIDSYVMSEYEEDHPKFALYRGNYLYWYDFLTKTKKNRRGRHYPRGIVSIISKSILL